jgi:hypothetical protein
LVCFVGGELSVNEEEATVGKAKEGKEDGSEEKPCPKRLVIFADSVDH